MVSGDRHHAEALREEVAAVLAPLGLRLSPEKTRVVHIDEGFDFLGFHIRRMRKRGTSKQYVYTTPSRKAIQSIKDKVRELTYRSTRYQDLAEVLTRLNQALAGWANYFRYGVSKAVFGAVDHHAWGRLMRWTRRKYEGRHRLGMPEMKRRFCGKGWRFAQGKVVFTGASSVTVKRYRYRQQYPDPLDPETGSRRQRRLTGGKDTWSARCPERGTPGAGGGLRETDGGNTETAPAGLPHPPPRAAHPCRVRTQQNQDLADFQNEEKKALTNIGASI